MKDLLLELAIGIGFILAFIGMADAQYYNGQSQYGYQQQQPAYGYPQYEIQNAPQGPPIGYTGNNQPVYPNQGQPMPLCAGITC